MVATPIVTKNFTATGSSDPVALNGRRAVFNVYGNGVGTLRVERLASDGSSYVPMTKADGTLFSLDKLTGDALSYDIDVGKVDDIVRITCSAFTSGTLKTEITQ